MAMDSLGTTPGSSPVSSVIFHLEVCTQVKRWPPREEPGKQVRASMEIRGKGFAKKFTENIY